MSIAEEIVDVLAKRREHQGTSPELENALVALQKRLLNGETTGDPLRDHLTIRYGDFTVAQRNSYIDFDRKLATRVGEDVLVVTPGKEAEFEGRCFGPGEMISREVPPIFRLGIVAEARSYNHCGIIVASCFAIFQKQCGWRETVKKLCKEPLVFDPSKENRKKKNADICVIGNNEVAKWFERAGILDQSCLYSDARKHYELLACLLKGEPAR